MVRRLSVGDGWLKVKILQILWRIIVKKLLIRLVERAVCSADWQRGFLPRREVFCTNWCVDSSLRIAY